MLLTLNIEHAWAVGTTHTISVSGAGAETLSREYQKVLPGNLAAGEEPAGILVALHGAGGSGPAFCGYAFSTDAERAKMIVLCPSATPATASTSKSGGSDSSGGGKRLRRLDGEGAGGCWRAFLTKGVCNGGNCEGPEDVYCELREGHSGGARD